MRLDKFVTAALFAAIADFDARRRVFAGKTRDGTWPYVPRVSQKKRRLSARRAA